MQNYSNDIRTDLDTISTTLDALCNLHKAGADRTTAGCQTMARMASTLESAFSDLCATINILEKV